MQKSTCTFSDRATGDATSADKPVHDALLIALDGALRGRAVASAVLVEKLAAPAIVSLIGIIGLIRICTGCGPPS